MSKPTGRSKHTRRLFPLRRLKNIGMGSQILRNFYSCTSESIFTPWITVWYGNSSALNHMLLQRVMWTAHYITVWYGNSTALDHMALQRVMQTAHYITAWYGNSTALDHMALQRMVLTAQYITGAELPAIQNIYIRMCGRKAWKIVKDSNHQSQSHSPCFCTASGRGASSLAPTGSLTASIPKQLLSPSNMIDK
jgi:hypothetical protein